MAVSGSVGFAGKADRIDRLSDGALRVVDYKTGKPHNRFRDVAALFSSVAAERSPAVLQTLLYAMMLSQSESLRRAAGALLRPLDARTSAFRLCSSRATVRYFVSRTIVSR